MYILVINGGSSSLKYQLFDMDTHKVMAKGLCERIGKGGHMRHTAAGKEKLEFDVDIPDHTVAARLVVEKLTDPQYGVLKDMSQIGAVGHRVLHGGQWFSESVVINDEVIAEHLHPAVPGIWESTDEWNTRYVHDRIWS